MRAAFWLRSRIADLVKDRFSCRDSPDLAARLSFYRSFRPTDPTELQTHYDKDKTDFLDSALENINIFVQDDLRKALHDLCWDEGKERSSLDYANNFNYALEGMTKKFPDLLEDDSEKSQEMVAIEELKGELKQLRVTVETLLSSKRKRWL